MSRGSQKKWRTVVWVALVGVVGLGSGLAGRVAAQANPLPPDNTHQEMLTLLTNLTTTLTGIVSSGVTCQPRRYYLTQRTHQAQPRSPHVRQASIWRVSGRSSIRATWPMTPS